MSPLVECVPNFSEGRDRRVIDAIASSITSGGGVRLLDVDVGAEANRTVYTIVGEPPAVVEAAFNAASCAVELIDMRLHRGVHPRLGAMDVCPLVPMAGVSMAQCVELAHSLGRRIGDELGVPVYFYERAALRAERRSLSAIRTGEYESLAQRLGDPDWAPDAGPSAFNPRTGAFVLGARGVLLAYNVSLDTADIRIASDIAAAIRESGRGRRDATGRIVRDDHGKIVRVPGRLKAVRAIGWSIGQDGHTEVSTNILDFRVTPLHQVFETIREEADSRGLLVTGSELIGLTPLEPMLEAGRHFLRRQGRSVDVSESALVHAAVASMGLEQRGPFAPDRKIIEYNLHQQGYAEPLWNLTNGT